VNVGFAGLQMNSDLGFSYAAVGFGSCVFFLGYCLFEIPSNLVLHRVGARRWISRIMISWGIISAAMMFLSDSGSDRALRGLWSVLVDTIAAPHWGTCSRRDCLGGDDRERRRLGWSYNLRCNEGLFRDAPTGIHAIRKLCGHGGAARVAARKR
jgi:hypothetical protein